MKTKRSKYPNSARGLRTLTTEEQSRRRLVLIIHMTESDIPGEGEAAVHVNYNAANAFEAHLWPPAYRLPEGGPDICPCCGASTKDWVVGAAITIVKKEYQKNA